MPTLRFTGQRSGAKKRGTRYGVVKPGDTVEVPDAVAERWLEKHPMGGVEARDLDASTKDDLQAEAEQRGLDTSGNKAELGARLDEAHPRQKHGTDWELVSDDPPDGDIAATPATTTVVPPPPAESTTDTGPAGEGGP